MSSLTKVSPIKREERQRELNSIVSEETFDGKPQLHSDSQPTVTETHFITQKEKIQKQVVQKLNTDIIFVKICIPRTQSRTQSKVNNAMYIARTDIHKVLNQQSSSSQNHMKKP
ncbi:hypothetical protein JTB14_024085 [Gonioctena quinquepunctata]|nr:hypothetical protein JTB14_024085 [Gonioctena quinquepunctata]